MRTGTGRDNGQAGWAGKTGSWHQGGTWDAAEPEQALGIRQAAGPWHAAVVQQLQALPSFWSTELWKSPELVLRKT